MDSDQATGPSQASLWHTLPGGEAVIKVSGAAGKVFLDWIKRALLGLALAAATGAHAGDWSGRPMVRSFGVRDYGADAQNWAIVLGANGLVYSANNQGVLEFDGERWRLIPTRLGSTPRALAVDAKGRVWVGGQNEFGFLASDDRGQLRFVPMEDQLPPEERQFGQVWSVHATSMGIFFVSPGRLFRWDGQQFRSWKAGKAFFLGYTPGGRFLVVDSGRGLLEIRGDALELVKGGEVFAERRPRFLVPWEEGGRKVLLAGIRKEGLSVFDEGRLRRLELPANRYLNENILYSGMLLAGDSVAMATIQGGVLILERGGQRSRLLTREDGLSNDAAYCLMKDPRGALWVGGSRGLDCIGWPPRLSRFGAAEGLSGVVLGVSAHGRDHYVATHQGLLRLPGNGRNPFTGRWHLQAVGGVKGQCWQLLPFGASLLVANYEGVFEVQGSSARRLPGPNLHSTSLAVDPMEPDRLWVGTVSGLYSYRQRGGRWVAEGPVGTITADIRTLTAEPDGSLWLGCDAPEVIRVRPDLGGQFKVERFGRSEGLPQESWFFTALLSGKARVYCPSGVFRFDVASGRFEVDPTLSALTADPERRLYRLTEASDGTLWLGQGPRGTWLRPARRNPNGIYEWHGPALNFAEASIFTLLAEGPDRAWFGGEEGLMRWESKPGEAPKASSPVLIRSVVNRGGESLFFGGSDRPLSEPALPYSGNALRFEFALPRFMAGVQYQVQLEGLERNWSPWSGESYRDYTNLRPGAYRFRVRAREDGGPTTAEATFGFSVLRPWHLTWWAYGGYGLGGLLLIRLFYQLRLRLLLKRNRELEARVAEATTELQCQADQLAEANTELRDLNEQKNRFLGIVSHDLKTPLSGIALAAETLKHAQDLDLVVRTAEAIEQESQGMGALITRFLNLAALESGQVQVRLQNVLLGSLLQERMDRHFASASSKGIMLELTELPRDLLVWADPLLLSEVLDNLLSNAVKFSRGGSRVRLEAGVQGDKVRIGVVDQGPGLSPEDHRKLFTRFARLSARPTAGEKSLGLGLAIAHQLVASQEGRIWAEPGDGGGTRFLVELRLP